MGRWGRAFGIGSVALMVLGVLPACGDDAPKRTADISLAGADEKAAIAYGRKQCAGHSDLERVRVRYFGMDPQPGSTGNIVDVRCPKGDDR